MATKIGETIVQPGEPGNGDLAKILGIKPTSDAAQDLRTAFDDIVRSEREGERESASIRLC